MARSQRPTRLAVFGVVVLGIAIATWYATSRPSPPAPVPAPPDEFEGLAPDPSPPDPRLTFDTVFRNVKPDVRYVGDASCATCHGDICTSYHAHPMGRSAFTIGAAPPLEVYGEGPSNPRLVSAHELRVSKTAAGVVHRVSAKDSTGAPLPDYVITPTLVVGSGTRGRSYLAVEKGAVWQSPISWFSADSSWGLSPGFDLGTGGRRAITDGCLFCHVNQVEPIPQSLNRYREPLFPGQTAIGCERCHGPGALHVTERAAGRSGEKVDTSIVNPKHLPTALQSAVCEQCHLQGQERVSRRGREAFEFRPGLPFEQFVTVFVRHPDIAQANRSVGQFEQMEQSRCFTSSGRLVCTSCHEPHKTPAPADRDRFYRGRCLTCHESKGCTAPAQDRAGKRDSCIACHMLRTDSSNIAHASVTDHRVLRRPRPPGPVHRLAPGEMPLLAFRTGPYAPPPAERERDLGLVLARLAMTIPADASGARTSVAGYAHDRLTGSLATWRGDADAWIGLAVARGARGEMSERFAAATAAGRLAPDSEPALTELADAAITIGKFDRAIEAAAKLIAMNPTAIEPRLARAEALIRQSEWEQAETDVRAALGTNPLHPQTRLYLALCRHRSGDPVGGRKEAETAAGLVPNFQQRARMLDWYKRETR